MIAPTLHEYPEVLVVMDGSRRVATARKHTNAYPPVKPGGRALTGYLLRAYGASFTDPRARKPNLVERAGGARGDSWPSLLLVRTRAEARSILRSMTGEGITE